MEIEIGIPHSCSYLARFAKPWPEERFSPELTTSVYAKTDLRWG